MPFNLSHGLAVVDSLVANRTFVELKGSNRVGPTLKAAGPVASHLSDFGAAARRADRDSQRIHLFSDSLLGRDQKIVRLIRIRISLIEQQYIRLTVTGQARRGTVQATRDRRSTPCRGRRVGTLRFQGGPSRADDSEARLSQAVGRRCGAAEDLLAPRHSTLARLDSIGEPVDDGEDLWWNDEGKDHPRLWWERE